MKKLLALFLILLLMLSAFGCAKPDEETGAEAGLVDTPAPQPEKTPEPEKEPVIKEPTPDTQTKEPEKEEPEAEEPQPTGDKAPFCDVKIDEPFSSTEVVVSLTLEESKKGLEYTEKDFAEYGVINVFPFDYYPEKYFPEYKDRQTLILMLDKDSKQNVLDSVKKLEQDERVYSCEPNFEYAYISAKNTYGYISLIMILTDEEERLNKEYKTFDFPKIKAVDNVPHKLNEMPNVDTEWYIYKCKRSFYVSVEKYEDIKELVADPRVERVYYWYYMFTEYELDTLYVSLTEKQFKNQKEYGVEDFEYLTNLVSVEFTKDIINSPKDQLRLTFKEKSKRNILNSYYLLKEDKRIANVSVYPATIIISG